MRSLGGAGEAEAEACGPGDDSVAGEGETLADAAGETRRGSASSARPRAGKPRGGSDGGPLAAGVRSGAIGLSPVSGITVAPGNGLPVVRSFSSAAFRIDFTLPKYGVGCDALFALDDVDAAELALATGVGDAEMLGDGFGVLTGLGVLVARGVIARRGVAVAVAATVAVEVAAGVALGAGGVGVSRVRGERIALALALGEAELTGVAALIAEALGEAEMADDGVIVADAVAV